MQNNLYKRQISFIFSVIIIAMFGSMGFLASVAHSGPSHKQTIESVQQFNAHDMQSSPDQEAQWTANQYQSMSQAIQADQQSKVAPTMNIYGMSIFSHIKAIARTIGEETTKLIELIMPGKPQTTETQRQVNVIINNLDNQRRSLTNYLSVQQSNTTTKKFDASKYDRPKDKKFHIRNPQ